MSGDLAQRLAEARLTGTAFDADTIEAPADIAAAYAIQAEVTALLELPRAGWKLGATNETSQKALGVGHPFIGPLLSRWCHSLGDTVAAPAPFEPGVEAEIVFQLNRGLPPREAPYSEDDVAAAVESVSGGIEIAGSRFAGGMGRGEPLLLIADGAANVAFVSGAPEFGWQRLDIGEIELVLSVNGVEAGRGPGRNALGHPMRALAWLANELSARGIGLAAGESITTGTCTGFQRVDTGDTVTATFGPLGGIEINIASG